MKILFITLSLLITSCDFRRPVQLPKVNTSQEIEVKVRELGLQIKTINELEIARKLNQKDASNFHARLKELITNYNKTSSLIKREYEDDEKDKLQLEYRKTKEIWDYIVFKYPI